MDIALYIIKRNKLMKAFPLKRNDVDKKKTKKHL